MTRSRLHRTLRWSYVALGFVLLTSLAAKLAHYLPGVAGTPFERFATDLYDYMKDMALVFITVVATVLAGLYQRRQSFIAALKEEWREIVDAKSRLYAYTRLSHPTEFDYVEAFTAISAAIDNMRTVYGNVGETDGAIGLYPFAPLHDMRRALQSLDPSRHGERTDEQKKLARDAMLQSFYALRETFLEELDLEPPDRPLLAWGGRRHKKPGAPDWVRKLETAERIETDAASPPDPRLDRFLRQLYEREQTNAKPWYAPGRAAGRPSASDAPSNGAPLAADPDAREPPLT
jgi:hypothetical protein